MTRRDFIMIANVLRDNRPRYNGVRWPVWLAIREQFKRELAQRCPGFDPYRFDAHTLSRKGSTQYGNDNGRPTSKTG